jgi:hydrogenase/urease accessory protein HupE
MTRVTGYLLLVFVAAATAMLVPAAAHEVRPGFLELRESEGGLVATTWKVPARGTYKLAIGPVYPDFCRATGEPISAVADNASITRGKLQCTLPLPGSMIRIRGLDATRTDVLVRIELAGGRVETDRLTPARTSMVVRADASAADVLKTYGALGVEHILMGTDHLLFVLCLILLVRDVRTLVATVTAFTFAHSITLAAATLGFVHVPSAPVEATIALSIVFLAYELTRDGTSLTRSFPWIVAFSFGLLHGLGFAGALDEAGLPQGDIPLALFAFNVGVELGQLAFIAAVLSLGAIARRLLGAPPAWSARVASYAIGATASFWMMERIAAA